MAKKTAKKPSAGGKSAKSSPPARAKKPKPAARVSKRKIQKKKPARKAPPRPPAKVVSQKLAKKKAPPPPPARPAHADKKKNRPEKTVKRSDHGKAAPPPVIKTLPPPQNTNGKPRKNQAGFSARELERFRELLLAKRRELIGDMSSMEREALRVGGGSNLSNLPIHMADMGTDNYEQEFTLGLVQKERDLLKEINLALGKINAGTYGLCEGTNAPIVKERLEFQPWARYSVDYQRKLERHGR